MAEMLSLKTLKVCQYLTLISEHSNYVIVSTRKKVNKKIISLSVTYNV